MKRPILNHTQCGECVYEPFLGSGTVLVACELTERICCGLEIHPSYVDMSISRWQSVTNREAVLHGTAHTFDQVRAQRLAGDSDTSFARTIADSEEKRSEE
jgi:hypothetical protein